MQIMLRCRSNEVSVAAEVVLGVGSNVAPERQVPRALEALARLLAGLRVSPVYACPAVGYEGPEYWNLVCAGHTRLNLAELKHELVALERQSGRPADLPPGQPRTLDLDILLYQRNPSDPPPGNTTHAADVCAPHPDILTQAYILRPLADLMPDRSHPDTGKTFAEHWRASEKGLPMRVVPLPGDPACTGFGWTAGA
ncbi:MAG: 2-amino-4-hydroxy-6-hydroxymethyldihydropteridine diphosphokinase [Gammaproteobacteria bacterium]|nr:MAG: 2-amino-4-hydroxy-6-hydroxymethyldihydropteridine diphosphokinase [Gammaproteobacteria bacterium]